MGSILFREANSKASVKPAPKNHCRTNRPGPRQGACAAVGGGSSWAVGSRGKARVVVGNAVVQESIKRKIAGGGLGFERFRHYQGVIDLRIDVTDISTQRFGFPAATASHAENGAG